MDTVVHIFLASFFAALAVMAILRLPFFKTDLPSRALTAAFLLKLLAGLALWTIYSFHYESRKTGDAFRYFDDAKVIYSALPEAPGHYLRFMTGIGDDVAELDPYRERMTNWEKPYNYGTTNDNRTVIRLNAFIHLFSFGYYHVHTVVFCFLSMIGLTAMYKVFRNYAGSSGKWGCFAACFLVPSVLFWGSGVLKEGVLFFALGMFLYLFTKLLHGRFTLSRLIGLGLFFLLLVMIKTYVLLMLLPSLVAWLYVEKTGGRYVLLKFLGVHLLVALVAFNIHRTGLDYDAFHMLQLKQQDFYNQAEIADAGSVIPLRRLEAPVDILKAMPQALFNALYRPHVLEMRNPLYVMPALENLGLIVLLLLPLTFFRRPTREEEPVLYTALFFTLGLACLIGLITPILGAIIRYQVPLLPFYIFVLTVLTDKGRLMNKLRKWRIIPQA